MEIKRVPISEVEVWEKNPRNVKTKDFERLKRQIQELGVYKPLICFKENGKYTTLGGNMRLRALKDLKLNEVDISIVKAETEAEKIKYALSDNDRVGQYDEQALAELTYPHIEEINLEDYRIDVGEPISLKDVIEDYAPDIDGEDDVPEIDDNPAITKMGDLFTLGKHRLLCGNATKEEDVKRLMGGKKADMVFTDPPYNVGFMSRVNKSHPLDYTTKPYKDDRDTKEWELFVHNFFNAINDNLKEGGCFYIWGADKSIVDYYNWKPSNFLFHQNIIWDKQWSFLARRDFLSGHEPCVYGWKKGKDRYFHRQPDNENYSDIWAIKKINPNEMIHSAQKPIRLAVRAIKTSSKSDWIILDLFLGSGTTLIACQKLNRICYGMEIEPKYCDVIITRYSNFTDIPEEEIRATRQ